jgi:hypothetical protein
MESRRTISCVRTVSGAAPGVADETMNLRRPIGKAGRSCDLCRCGRRTAASSSSSQWRSLIHEARRQAAQYGVRIRRWS